MENSIYRKLLNLEFSATQSLYICIKSLTKNLKLKNGIIKARGRRTEVVEKMF